MCVSLSLFSILGVLVLFDRDRITDERTKALSLRRGNKERLFSPSCLYRSSSPRWRVMARM